MVTASFSTAVPTAARVSITFISICWVAANLFGPRVNCMKIVNPFYAALVVVGLVFALTACAYTVMSFQNLDPHAIDQQGVGQLMKSHGLMIIIVELGLLGVLTVAAISSDDYWLRRAEGKKPT